MAGGETVDLLVIGGGINGAGIARDAAGRGLKVLLVEQGDLAQGTSSASTKLIHGGLRYLEYYEFRLVREALKELGLALDAGAMPVMLMGQLRAAAEKLPAPRVRSAIDAVFRTDLALKSSGGEPRVLLERLTVELCEARRARM